MTIIPSIGSPAENPKNSPTRGRFAARQPSRRVHCPLGNFNNPLSGNLHMYDFLITRLLLAADEQRPPSMQAVLIYASVGILCFYLMVMRPAGRDRKKVEDLLANLKKNDRVLTSGGIIGSVVMLSQDGKEITLKVDDNTRIKFHRNFITKVLIEEKKDDAEKKS